MFEFHITDTAEMERPEAHSDFPVPAKMTQAEIQNDDVLLEGIADEMGAAATGILENDSSEIDPAIEALFSVPPKAEKD